MWPWICKTLMCGAWIIGTRTGRTIGAGAEHKLGGAPKERNTNASMGRTCTDGTETAGTGISGLGTGNARTARTRMGYMNALDEALFHFSENNSYQQKPLLRSTAIFS